MAKTRPTVWIDPGHGGKDPGAVSPGGRTEKQDNLVFAASLTTAFKRQGFDVVATRTDDKTISLTQRTKIENQNDCDLAISCHRNGAASTDANGVEIWIHSGAGQGICNWAGDMIKGFETIGFKVRGGTCNPGVNRGYIASPKQNYWVNAQTQSPSMLLELGFMGNDRDNMLFDKHLGEIAEYVVKSSCKYLGRSYTAAATAPSIGATTEQNTADDDQYQQAAKELEQLVQKYEEERKALVALLDRIIALLGE